MKRNKITAVILSIVMSMSLMIPSVEVLADETSVPSETQKTETVETEESKATETQTPKETEKEEPKETEKSEAKETEKQEPAESDETQITETAGSDKKAPAESKDNGDNPEESNETVVEGKTPSQSASTPKKNAVTGTCGVDLAWTFEDGILTISGSGKMSNNYTNDYGNNPAPWKEYRENISSVVFSGKITSIGSYAFNGCKSLTSITIPNSVTSIGDGAFCNCTSLTSITIQNSITSISAYAFQNCSNLTSITVPNSVTSIGDGAFAQCSKLTSITIPNGVTSIGEFAFSECSSLTSITIPNSITSISAYAFQSCSNLTSITIPNSVTSIGDYVFYRCSSLTSITIPNGVTRISDYAFRDCTGLTSITLSNNVTKIGAYSFYGCTGLTSITLPNNVTTIDIDAFYGCSSLTSITIPNSVTSIGTKAFKECTGLKDIYYSGTKKDWEKIYLGYYNDGLSNATIHYSQTSATSGNCGENLTWSFAENGTLTISGSGDMYDFDESASPWKGLDIQTVVFDGDVTSFGAAAFAHCSKLTSITIPNGVTSIGDYAFLSCSNLTSITIPNSVTSIGSYAFGDCSSLTDVFYFGTEDNWKSITVGNNNEPLQNANILYAATYSITVNCGTSDLAKAAEGTTVTLTANDAPVGKEFDKWIVVSGNVSFANKLSSTTTFTMPAESVEVTATYKDVEYTIKVNNGSATPATATAGTVITLTADAAPSGKVFDKWIVNAGSVSLSNASSSTTTFAMSAENVEITATYKTVPSGNYIVKVNNGVATPSTSAPGLVVNVTANEAPKGVEFDKWEVVSGTVIFADSSSATTFFVMPAENVEITAKYKSSLSVKGKTATVKYSKLKKKNQSLEVSKVLTFVDKGQGQLSFTKVSGDSKILINKTTGNITVKKKLKKKTYTVKVKVMASGNESCNPSEWKTVTFKIKVK